MAMNYREVGKDHREGQWTKGVAIMDATAAVLKKQGLLPEEFTQEVAEQLVEPLRFTDKDREALEAAGAVLIIPQGLSLQDQREVRRPFWH